MSQGRSANTPHGVRVYHKNTGTWAKVASFTMGMDAAFFAREVSQLPIEQDNLFGLFRLNSLVGVYKNGERFNTVADALATKRESSQPETGPATEDAVLDTGDAHPTI